MLTSTPSSGGRSNGTITGKREGQKTSVSDSSTSTLPGHSSLLAVCSALTVPLVATPLTPLSSDMTVTVERHAALERQQQPLHICSPALFASLCALLGRLCAHDALRAATAAHLPALVPLLNAYACWFQLLGDVIAY